MTSPHPERPVRRRLRRVGYTVGWLLITGAVAVPAYAVLVFGGR